jgi:uncharacterized integral membrane protein
MVRLIGFILVFVLFLTFIVLNLDNKCDISFGFKTVLQVPVFITAFSSFVLGMLFCAPFVLFLRRKRSGRRDEAKLPKQKGAKKFAAGASAEDKGSPAGEVPEENTLQ